MTKIVIVQLATALLENQLVVSYLEDQLLDGLVTSQIVFGEFTTFPICTIKILLEMVEIANLAIYLTMAFLGICLLLSSYQVSLVGLKKASIQNWSFLGTLEVQKLTFAIGRVRSARSDELEIWLYSAQLKLGKSDKHQLVIHKRKLTR